MAENNLTTYITANADFSSLRTQLAAVTAQLVKLQETTVGTNAKLGNQIAVMNKAFSDTLRSTGQFSTHFVTLSSDVQKFGKNLDQGQLKLNQYFKVWQGHTKNTGNLIRDLAKQQVMLEQAIVQPLGKNAQGMMQYNIQVAKGLDEIKNKTALARQEASIMNKVMQDGAGQLINWGKNTQWAGRQLTVGLTVPLAAFGAAAQKAFLDANTEMVRLTKVYGGLAATSSAELAKVQKDVSDTAKTMASSYGVAYKDTIALAADMAATGKQGNDLIASTVQTTRLSVLGEIDRQSAMKATLAIQNTFKQNTDQLTQSIDFLNAVENQTSTSLQDLTDAIPKAGPVIQAMGGSVKDLALYLTAMKEGGIDATAGANALKSALASLVNPTKVATDMFSGFGIDLKGIVNKNAGDLTGTILNLQAALDTLDPLKKQQAIEQLFGKFQFARMNALFANLGKQGSQTLKVLDLMKASSQDLANVSSRELSMMTESASGKYKRALASVQADLAQVGKQFLTISTYVLRIVDGIVKFFDKLPAPIKTALGFLGGITAVAGPLIMLTGVLGNFVGYVIKGVFNLKSLIKGGQGFKLLTPEIIAANEAGKGLQSTFYNDAEATNVLKAAVDTLSESFSNLEIKANAAKVAMNPAITTVANSVILPGKENARVVDKNNPLVGKPYSRQMSHLVPAGMDQPGTIFGTVPGPGPVNVRIGKNPQAYMSGDMPKIPGVTSINGTSTGIVAGEAAKWHSMVGALAMQSEQEIKLLKEEVAATGTVTVSLSQSYQALLPEITKITELAATETSAIVGELESGKLTADAARTKIVELNLVIEKLIAQTSSDIAATMGRNINLTTVPLTGQPVVGPNGKSNMKEMFHKGNVKTIVDKIAAALGGVRTSGAGYSIQTTKPQKLNTGGPVYLSEGSKNVVPGVGNTDTVPAMLTPGEFVVNKKATEKNMPLLQAINNGAAYSYGGKVTMPKMNYGPVTVQQRDVEKGLADYINFHQNENTQSYEDQIRARAVAIDTAQFVKSGLYPDYHSAFEAADARYGQALKLSRGEQGYIDPHEFASIRSEQLIKLNEQVVKAGKSPILYSGENLRQNAANSLKRYLAHAIDVVGQRYSIEGINPATSAFGHIVPINQNQAHGMNYTHNAALMPYHLNYMGMTLSRAKGDNGKPLLPGFQDVIHPSGIGANNIVQEILHGAGLGNAHPTDVVAHLRGSVSGLNDIQKMKLNKFIIMLNKSAARKAMIHLALGGPVTSKKHNYGIMNSNAFMAKNPHLYSSNPKATDNPLGWMKLGVHPAVEEMNQKLFSKYPNGQMPVDYANQKRPAGMYPMPASYYQDIVNSDPLHGPLQIGRYQSPIGIRNQQLGARIRYQGSGFMKAGVEPAFAIGTLESRAKTSLFNYMQGDYAAIDDPAVQQYLSSLRTKFTGTLHRGVRNVNSLPPVIRDLINAGKWNELVGKEFIMRRSSWSTNKDTAEGFGPVQLTATVKNRNAVPASQIFPDLTFHSPSGPVHVNESEVYMGGKFKVVKAAHGHLQLQAVYDAKRENGGPVNSGRSYLVGEKGPELFVPRNSGGIIPHYALGGRVHSGKHNYGIASTGGALVLGMLSQMLGSKIGGVPGTVLSTAGNILPWMFMGANKTTPKGPINSSPWTPPEAREPGWMPPGTKTPGFIGKRMPWATKQIGLAAKATTALEGGAAGGGKFASMLGKIALMGTRANLVIGGVTLAVMAGIKIWKQHQEFVRVNAVGYGLTATAAQKAGLKYKDYNSVIKDAMQNAKDLAERNKLVYESLQDSGTPLSITIEQYKKLKTEVKSVYSDQIKAINQSKDDKSAIALALRLKEQLIAGGMAADEATKKIYTMFQMSNKANLAVTATTGNKAFNRASDAKTSSLFAVRDYGTATTTQREGSAQAAQFNTAMSSVEAGIQQRISDSEKAARKDLTGKTQALTYLQAEKQQLDYINQASGTQTKITQSTIDELAKADPNIKKMVTTSDTLTSVWGKLRLLAAGFAGDLSQLDAKQVKALQDMKDVIETTVIAKNKEGLLKGQYANLDKLTKQQKAMQLAAQGQSVQQQINSRDAIAALQKQIDANNKLTEARLKALDVAKAEADLGNEIAKKKAEYDSAVATGNSAQAQQSSLDMQALQKQLQYNAQKKAIEDANTLKNTPLQAKIDSLNKGQQALSDKSALAGEQLGKVTTSLEDQKTKIDNVNSAMVTLELNARAAGKSVTDYANGEGKGMAAQILVALKAAGATMPATKDAKGKPISVGAQAATALQSFGMDSTIGQSLLALGGGATLQSVVDAITGNKNTKAGVTPGKNGTGFGNPTVTVEAKTIKEAAQKAITDKQSKQFVTDQNPTGYYLFKWKDANYAVDKQTNQVYKFDAVKNKLGAKVSMAAGGKLGVISGESFLVGENGPELFQAKGAGNIIPSHILQSLKAANPSYQLPTGGLKVSGASQGQSGSVINLTQNIYPSDGMNTDAFVRQVVTMTKQAIGQDAKLNAKMVGTSKNVSIK
jgi:TP901 family phage tail tape measure protein